MEFKKSRGSLRDVDQLGYRITRSKVSGLPIRYYACVRVVTDGRKWWNFCWHRRPYKTQKKAAEACEFNRKLWAAVIDLGEATGRRDSRLAALAQRGRKDGGDVLGYTPLWALKKVDPVLMRMLWKPCKNQSDDSEVSESTPPSDSQTSHTPDNSSSTTPDATPALNVSGTASSSGDESSVNASSVKARSTGRRKNTKASTAAKSRTTKRPRKSTKS